MRQSILALVIALVTSIGLAAPGTHVPAASAADAQADPPKVVIIVGATHGATDSYRQKADVEYAEAIKYTPNVTKIYSPNATWAAVSAAVSGADIVIYHGHGNGWPSPYNYDPKYTTKDGFGLNATAGNGDNNNVYYGEPYIRSLNLNGAIVLLHNLCYAAGNSEPGDADPTRSVAMQRVDNYGAAFLAAGATAVVAEGHAGASYYLRQLLTTDRPIDEIWRNAPNYNGNEFSFSSSRTPGAVALMDPDSPSGGYYRSIVGRFSAATADAPPRYAGVDRFATAAEISKAHYAPGVDAVYVATGMNFPDALAGASAAGKLGAPLLLVTRDAIPDATAAELTRLAPKRIVILGSAGVVSDRTAGALAAYAPDGVTRIAGGDRFATAAEISKAHYAPGVDAVYVATGMNFPDALAGASAAGKLGAPLLLVTRDAIPDATAAELTRLAPKRIVILGSAGVVSDRTAGALAAYAPDGVTRIAGGDRFATAAEISKAHYAPGVDAVYVATGMNFPDALAGASAAGKLGAPLLLVTRDAIPDATAAELTRLAPKRIVILGSTGVVSAIVGAQLAGYVAG